MEKNIEFIDQLTKKFEIFDRNFWDGYISMIKKFYNYLLSEGYIHSQDDIINYAYGVIDHEIDSDKKVTPDETVKKVLAFFKTLGPRYEEMAINILRDTTITKGKLQCSSAYNVLLSGNDYDASIMVHEITHSFVASKELAERKIDVSVPEDRYSSLFPILSEINSYVFQFLFYDYCIATGDEKQGKYDMVEAMLVVADLIRKIKYIEKSNELYKIIIDGKAKENMSKVFADLHLDPSTKQDSQYTFSNAALYVSHPFGIMIACYIYQKILEDPKNMIMCSALEKAQTVVGDEEATLKYLEELGIPCFKNGKISLDDVCVSQLLTAMIKTFEMLMDDKKKKTTHI